MSSGDALVCRRSRFSLDLSGWVSLACVTGLCTIIDSLPASSRITRALRKWSKHGSTGWLPILVVRVLAEDVVCRLEEVLDTILAAVAFCRQQAPRS
jgi:hypothetical protein